MILGLKRGTVVLADHDPKWEKLAAQAIERLWNTFGSTAKDIQHVGSTAIKHIKAKPIIDIAIAVDDFAEVEALTLTLENAGFLRRHWETGEQMLFAVGDYSKPDGIVTHFIHVVNKDSTDWINYINFRNYLNADIVVAKAYEDLKIKLAKENPGDKGREKYLAGKYEFIKQTLPDALTWSYVHDIPRFDSFEKIELVNKGWSNDKKYYIETIDGKRLLLRVTDIAEYDRKKIEFEMMQRVMALGVPMSQPVAFGTCADGKSVYSLLTWCDGKEAEEILPSLTETEQYVLGLKSGEILKKMHSIPAPETQEVWAVRFNRKTDYKIQKYRECGLRFDGDDQIIDYIGKNRKLLENRPQCYQHGDYHVGNMILSPENELSIIDFNRPDFGDPWEEFNRIVWSAAVSPHFATGQLNGYFGGQPPLDFFRLLAFYIASNTLSSIYWAIPFGQSDLDTMMRQSQDVLRWFDNMQNPIPTWYLKDFYLQYIDGVPYKLKAPFDFSFINKYGKVFKVFDDQDSGNICFGIKSGDEKYFLKFAGAPTERACVSAEEAVSNLKRIVPIYKDLAHPNLIKLVDVEEIGGGFAMAFEWVDAECMHPMYPMSRQKFMQMPLETRFQVFDDILDFHAHVAKRGYVAIDFYDGSIMYDFNKGKTVICDIDFYTKAPYINNMGRMWGSSRFMSPEEYEPGAVIDEITNVYTMGAAAFALFGDESDRCIEKWKLSKELFEVAQRAVSDERDKRQQSIEQLINEWEAAK